MDFNGMYEGASFVQRKVTFTFMTPHAVTCPETDAEKCDGSSERVMEELTESMIAARLLGMPNLLKMESQAYVITDPTEYDAAKNTAVEVARRAQYTLDNILLSGLVDESTVSPDAPPVKVINAEDMTDDMLRKQFGL